MSNGVRWFRRIAAIGLLVVVILVVCGYQAVRHEPSFYREQVALAPQQQRQASDKLLAQATAAANAARHEGQWSLTLTEEQINGWLAVDLPENHRKLLPSMIQDPRVRLKPHEATIACRYQQGNVQTVLSLLCDVYLAEPNVAAIRFRRLRAGAVPMPLQTLLDQLTQLAEGSDVRLRWSRQGDDPVALIELPPLSTQRRIAYHIEAIEVRDGEFFLAGHSSPTDASQDRDEPK